MSFSSFSGGEGVPLPDVFKAPAFASPATWFGAICTLLVLPGAVAGLAAYFITQALPLARFQSFALCSPVSSNLRHVP